MNYFERIQTISIFYTIATFNESRSGFKSGRPTLIYIALRYRYHWFTSLVSILRVETPCRHSTQTT